MDLALITAGISFILALTIATHEAYMGKKRRSAWTAQTLTPLIKALQEAAVARAGALGHVMPGAGAAGWQSAKKKYGHHSSKAFCASCGAMTVVMPLGNVQASTASPAHNTPGVRGDGVFVACRPVGGKPTQLLLRA